ncbi:TIR-NBS-LRR resistance protein, partial [Trifolium medium]|nr:TIR-NBS-LRR resistance protein [Trifolium medium]
DGIELGARLNSENEEGASLDHHDDDDVIWYLLPAMPVRKYWCHYPSTQVSVTLELPPYLLKAIWAMV